MSLDLQPARTPRVAPILVGIVVVLCGLFVVVAPSFASTATVAETQNADVEADILTSMVVERDLPSQQEPLGDADSCVAVTQISDGTNFSSPVQCVGQP